MAANNRNFPRKGVDSNDQNHRDTQNVGNNKSYKDIQIPPDNVGNIKEDNTHQVTTSDAIGNTLDGDPTHLKSGILMELSHIDSIHKKKSSRNNYKDDKNLEKMELLNTNGQRAKSYSCKQKIIENYEIDTCLNELKKDFKHLLKIKQGQSFAFTLFPINQKTFSKQAQSQVISALEILINSLMNSNDIEAEVYYKNYKSEKHDFTIFFIDPIGTALDKKNLIKAIRKTAQNYLNKISYTQSNIFIVLANAKEIIEKHLAKVGAHEITYKPST